MFCVIQEIERKKQPKPGYSKELVSKYMRMTIQGEDCSHWWYYYSDEKFERTIKTAYKISIHQSERIGGKVHKKQFVLCTVGFYELVDDYFTLYDYCDSKIQITADELGVSIDSIYDEVEKKLEPIKEKAIEIFIQTEEYKTHEEHERITTMHAARKTQFNEKYGFDARDNEYDQCYDVFGVLQNPERLKQIEKQYQERIEYEKKSSSYRNSYYGNYSNSQGSSYYDSSNSNYNNYQESSYFKTIGSNYNDTEKEQLKQFYRVLSRKFHPDANPDKDTSGEMQLINKLKEQWGL